MSARAKTAEFSVSKKLSWPQVCVLCLKPATKEGFLTVGGGRVPYCDECHARVQRLTDWKDGTFMISLIIGALAAVGGVIMVGTQEGWLALIRVQSWFQVGAVGLAFMGMAYAIIYVMLLPLRLILHSRLAAPGVKVLKSKKPGVTRVRFANREYAAMFKRANGLPTPG